MAVRSNFREYYRFLSEMRTMSNYSDMFRERLYFRMGNNKFAFYPDNTLSFQHPVWRLNKNGEVVFMSKSRDAVISWFRGYLNGYHSYEKL